MSIDDKFKIYLLPPDLTYANLEDLVNYIQFDSRNLVPRKLAAVSGNLRFGKASQLRGRRSNRST
jgi:hypothetical protein